MQDAIAETSPLQVAKQEQTQHALTLVDQTTSPTRSNRLRPVLALDAFTQISKKGSPDAEILERGDKLARQEAEASPFLPTIGLEIEGHFAEEDMTFLRKLGFSAGRELQHLPGRAEPVHLGLKEIRLPPTRDSLVQTATLNNLIQAGILPVSLLPREVMMEQFGVEKGPTLSTHLNFGLDEQVTREMTDKQRNELTAISDAFTAAYVSPERLRERKTTEAWAVKEATPDVKEKGGPQLLRAELRTGEIAPYDTQRSIRETQRIAACWQAYVKQKNNLPLTPVEHKLAHLWQRGYTNELGQEVPGFMKAVEFARNKYGWTPGLPDTDKHRAADILQDQPMIKFDMGLIMVDFANEVDKILGASSRPS